MFIHHSTGENWLRDDYGELGRNLDSSNYFVSDTNYGWGPDAIGDRPGIRHLGRPIALRTVHRVLDVAAYGNRRNSATTVARINVALAITAHPNPEMMCPCLIF